MLLSTAEPAPGSARESQPVWSVGAVADELGIPASTVRTWERRYGMAPSVRTAGGHRRYSPSDVERMRFVTQLVRQGIPPSEAVETAKRSSPAVEGLPTAHTSEQSEQWIERMIAAAGEFDSALMRKAVTDVVFTHGAAGAWNHYLDPMLRRVGNEWSAGTLGVDAEHLVSEVVLTVLRARIDRADVHATRPSIILACAEDDQHSLPIVALHAALAENKVAVHGFGQRLPAGALAGIVTHHRPQAVFLWASLRRSPGDRLHRVIAALSAHTTVVLGGPGWGGAIPSRVSAVNDLTSAMVALVDATSTSSSPSVAG